MRGSAIMQDAKDMCQILEMRKVGIMPKTFRGDSCISVDEICGSENKINIMLIINIIPNSFVLSYLAALQVVLAKHFSISSDTNSDKSATIKILFMESAIISKGSAWESHFIDHYKGITPECEGEDGEDIRRTLLKLKRSEFESFINMVLHSFNDPCIKKAIRKGKIEIHFNNLSKERNKLNISKGNSDDNEKKLDEFKAGEFSKYITEVQNSMFFSGGDHAVILEMERLLNYSIDNTKEKFIYIATDVFKIAIDKCYPDLWNNIKKNTFWFNDPPMRDGKMLMYLNPLSDYVNEAKKIKYIELEEFYHYCVLKDLNSTLFKNHLDEMPNAFNVSDEEGYNEEGYNEAFNEKLGTEQQLDHIQHIISSYKKFKNLPTFIEDLQSGDYFKFNILQLRSHQMDVMNNGFLSAQDEIIKQLDLVL